MAKKIQTRRSISIRGVTYNHLRAHCAAVDLSMSDFIEQRIAEFFEKNKSVMPAQRLAVAPPPGPYKPAPYRPLAPPPVAIAPPPRPMPVKSTIVAKNATALASRRSAPIAPPAPAPVARAASAGGPTGRPKPTPAAEVLRDRAKVATARDSTDYRALRF